MTALCRDIFKTQGDDSFGHGPNVSYSGQGAQNSTAVIIAVCGGLIGSALVFYALRGGFDTAGREARGIEFTRVSNEDNLTA